MSFGNRLGNVLIFLFLQSAMPSKQEHCFGQLHSAKLEEDRRVAQSREGEERRDDQEEASVRKDRHHRELLKAHLHSETVKALLDYTTKLFTC